VACDLVVWRALKAGAISLPARLCIDLADVAFWSARSDVELVANLAAEIAVELEAGMSWGALGLAVPALEAAASTASRRARRSPADLQAHVPHFGAVLAGMALRWTERARLDEARLLHSAELSAKQVRSFLAGQNDVAMGAGSIVDQLTPIAMLLEASAPESPLTRVRAGWKASLADQSASHGVYLDQALRLWQQRHNEHPDLSGFVVVTTREGEGTTLLTGYQARELAIGLEDLSLRGEVLVELAHKRSSGHTPRTPDRLPGREFDLLVNGMPVAVPKDPAVHVAEFEAAPVALLFGAFAALMPIRREDGSVPLGWAGLSCASYLVASRRFFQRRPAQPNDAVAVALGLAVSHGAVCSRFARAAHSAAGRQLYPGTYGLAPAMIVLPASWSGLSRAERHLVLVALAGITCLAYAVVDQPRSLLDLAWAMAWPMAGTVASITIPSAMARQSERLADELERDDRTAQAAAFEAGRKSVLDLVAKACEDAKSLLEMRRDLPDGVRAEIERRLAAIQ